MRPFLFHGCASTAQAISLVDNGAPASFGSLKWCRKNHISPKPQKSTAVLVDNSSFNIVGQLNRCLSQLKGFRVLFQFLVADFPGLEIVLGQVI
jgi:hypothetical protein